MNQNVSYPVVYVEDAKLGGFTAFTSAVEGAIAEGDTKEEAFTNLREAIAIIAEERRERVQDKFNDSPEANMSLGHLNMSF